MKRRLASMQEQGTQMGMGTGTHGKAAPILRTLPLAMIKQLVCLMTKEAQSILTDYQMSLGYEKSCNCCSTFI